MAFTSGSMIALRSYLVDNALNMFNIISFQYEPNLMFDRQIRESIASIAGDFAKKHGNKEWIAVGYARDSLSYTLKRGDVVRETISVGEYLSDWKRREVNTYFKFVFVSPSPDLLEELEERVIVKDLGVTLYPTVNVNVRDSEKKIKYTFPFEYLLNVEKFEIQNFSHLDDINQGVFSIFSMNAKVNYPVYVVDKVYDGSSSNSELHLCTEIHLTVDICGDLHYEIIK